MTDNLDNTVSEVTSQDATSDTSMPSDAGPSEAGNACSTGGYLRWFRNASYATVGLLVAGLVVTFAFPESAVGVSQVLPVEYRDAIFGTTTCDKKEMHPSFAVLKTNSSLSSSCCQSEAKSCCPLTAASSQCESSHCGTESPSTEGELTFASLLAAAKSGEEKTPPTPPAIDY